LDYFDFHILLMLIFELRMEIFTLSFFSGHQLHYEQIHAMPSEC